MLRKCEIHRLVQHFLHHVSSAPLALSPPLTTFSIFCIVSLKTFEFMFFFQFLNQCRKPLFSNLIIKCFRVAGHRKRKQQNEQKAIPYIKAVPQFRPFEPLHSQCFPSILSLLGSRQYFFPHIGPVKASSRISCDGPITIALAWK